MLTGKLYLICILALVVTHLLPSKVFAQDTLKKDEGYILIAIYVESGYLPTKITLEGTGWGNDITIKDLEGYNNYRLLAVSEGTYKFDRIYLNRKNYFNIEEQEFELKVVAGKVNYAGDLSIQTGMNSGHSGSTLDGAMFFFNNKSSQALKYLEKNHIEHLKNYPLNYSGRQRDHFFDYVSQEMGVN